MMNASLPPLCVDLDGTLLKTDLLWEGLLLLIKRKPWFLLRLPFWLLLGKAGFKAKLSCCVMPEPMTMPYCQEVLQFVIEQKSEGQPVVLVTASHERWATAIVDHLSVFNDAIATGEKNLSGSHKAAALVERYGRGRFDYIGNSADDLAVWAESRRAIVANASSSVETRAKELANVVRVIQSRQARFHAYTAALRVHQWLKNILLFVPLVAGHRAFDPAYVPNAVLAFMAFTLCASSVYVTNDLFDLASDRAHPTKRDRPFASGALSLPTGIVLSAVLLVSSMGISTLLPIGFAAVLLVYYLLTLVYTFGLKRFAVLDVMTLATLYTVRIIAGSAATDIPMSLWLLAFAMFMFLSLAVVKRYAELKVVLEHGKQHATGRGYQTGDMILLLSMGCASGYGAVLVLALYINSDMSAKLYSEPRILWLLCPILLYWVSRVWLITQRGKMHEDPVAFALHDDVSRVLLIISGLVIWGASTMEAVGMPGGF